MTDTNTTTPPTGSQIDADAVSGVSGTPGTPEAENGSQGSTEKTANREARYRVERNSAREALATANARIERMQQAEVERIAGEHLAQGSDLLGISGNELSAYLDQETGEIDVDRIRADARVLIEERPGLSKHTGAFDPSQGLGGSTPKTSTPTWGSVFS